MADIGVIGLAVMGQNLILNLDDHGFVVCAHNRTNVILENFLKGEAKGTKVIGARSIPEFCSKLFRPRRIILMVKAGKVVDQFIEQLLLYIEPGDIVIDGGNSEYKDTRRRTDYLDDRGIFFVGMGVSGGEDGARYGPSLMPGGNVRAWPAIREVFQAIAAKVDGAPCCEWIGSDGAGHFVKMVHNGIEYADMQLICEAYHMIRDGLGMSHQEIGEVFDEWSKSDLSSYLIEITADIMKHKDSDGKPLLTKILDTAGQKGTGKWTVSAGLEFGVPLTIISEAVFARMLSVLKEERILASQILRAPNPKFKADIKNFTNEVRDALYAAKIAAYAQGFMLMRAAAKEYQWELNYGDIALMWRGGCIIRSVFLGKIRDAFDKDPTLPNILLDNYFRTEMLRCQESFRQTVARSALGGTPAPCFAAALAFYDAYRSETLPANLIQAQRDYFGGHTYERIDDRGVNFHTNWSGHGGNIHSSSYNA